MMQQPALSVVPNSHTSRRPQHELVEEVLTAYLADPYADADFASKLAACADGGYISEVSRCFAPAFGIEDQRRQDLVAAATVCFDYFCRTVDRVTDAQGGTVTGIHLGSLALARGLALAASVAKETGEFIRRWEFYLRQASEAERYLWRHRGIATAYGPTDFQMMGQKNATVKSSPALMAACSGRWSDLEAVERAVDHIAVAVQIFDDLTDWQEDLDRSYYSSALSAAVSGNVGMSRDLVQRTIFSDGVAADLIAMAEERVSEALVVLDTACLAEFFPVVTSAKLSLTRLGSDMKQFADDPGAAEQFLLGHVHPLFAYHP